MTSLKTATTSTKLESLLPYCARATKTLSQASEELRMDVYLF